jgi:quinol monooxygenase YgiN
LTFIAKLTIQAGKEQEFEAQMHSVVLKVREESGNHACIMHRAADNSRLFMFYKEYTDQAALEAHRQHLRELGVDLRAMIEGPPGLEFFDRLA